MTQKRLYPDWRDVIVYSATGPQPQKLAEAGESKAMMAGLQAGQVVPPHPEGSAIYHFLEGTGWMLVGDERLSVQAGATVVVPAGTPRGIEAETQLAFLGVHLASKGAQAAGSDTKWRPLIRYGLVVMFGLMIVGMVLYMVMLSGSGGRESGMWEVMIVPVLGMLVMLLAMTFVFRRMAGGGPMARMMTHHGPVPGRADHHRAPQTQSKESAVSALTLDIPAVNCDHCKMRIEREVGQLPGVAMVSVDVEARQAVIEFAPPATRAQIEALLAEIGYPSA